MEWKSIECVSSLNLHLEELRLIEGAILLSPHANSEYLPNTDYSVDSFLLSRRQIICSNQAAIFSSIIRHTNRLDFTDLLNIGRTDLVSSEIDL